jgi:CarD family transcriptional regulator
MPKNTAHKATVSKSSKAPISKSSSSRTAKAVAKTAAKTISKTAAKPASAKTAAAKPAASRALPARAPAAKGAVKPAARSAKPASAPPRVEEVKKTTQRLGFKTHEYVVYPAHGVGQIQSIEEQEIAGARLELFVINFTKDKMTLRVPTAKIGNVGMRKLAEPTLVKKALETLKGRARIKRTMWSRRAQEYEAKINSGDIVAIAEVVRDLYRSESQPEQSYSERQLYEAALDRLSREIAVVHHITETEAIKEVEASLIKGPRRGAKAVEAEGAADGEADEADFDTESDDSLSTDEAA